MDDINLTTSFAREIFQVVILSLSITWATYMGYRSKLRLLKAQARSEQSIKQLNQAMENVKPILHGLRESSEKIERFNNEYKDKRIQCIEDIEKYCSLCKGEKSCPLQNPLQSSLNDTLDSLDDFTRRVGDDNGRVD